MEPILVIFALVLAFLLLGEEEVPVKIIEAFRAPLYFRNLGGTGYMEIC